MPKSTHKVIIGAGWFQHYDDNQEERALVQQIDLPANTTGRNAFALITRDEYDQLPTLQRLEAGRIQPFER